jgi:hypothetical protein
MKENSKKENGLLSFLKNEKFAIPIIILVLLGILLLILPSM